MNAGKLTISRDPASSLAGWALAYIESDSLGYKLSPPPLPRVEEPELEPLRLSAPGRPRELVVSWDKYKAPRSAEALRDDKKRAHLLHTFFHHELQAAELMCWAVLAFPRTPLAFRRGLLGICLDEVRHMNAYAVHVRELGFAVGSFAVRDWFWQRTPSAQTPAQFVATMGLGFEAGNLDHSERYVRMFNEAGDARAAALQGVVAREEVSHVEFGAHWFQQFTGELAFPRWVAELPAPLSPMVMRGLPLARAARRSAGLGDAFLDELEAWQPRSPG